MWRLCLLVIGALALTVPGTLAGMGTWWAGPVMMVLASGLTIMAAATLMVWSLQATPGLPRALKLCLIGLAALLPELAIDAHHAWVGAAPQAVGHASLTLAAFTGSSRVLLGLALPLVILVASARGRGNRLRLDGSHAIELSSLFLATLYLFTIFIRGYFWALDTPILALLFGVYVWRSTRGQHRAPAFQDPDSIGAAQSGIISRPIVTIALFGYAAFCIWMTGQLFAHSLFMTGLSIGLGQFDSLQLAAPIVSKLPLVVGAIVLAWRDRASSAASSLLTSQIGLVTLLMGVLPLVILAHKAVLGEMDVLVFADRQRAELLLVASQSLYAVALMSSLSVSWRTAAVLLAPFSAEWLLSALQPEGGSLLAQGAFAVFYLVASIAVIVGQRSRIHVLAGLIAPTTQARSRLAEEASAP